MRCHLLGWMQISLTVSSWSQYSSPRDGPLYLMFGGIFDLDDKNSKAGYLYGIAAYNNHEWQRFKLSSCAKIIDVKSSFELATAICAHMSEGAFLIYGARPPESANIVKSYTETFHIPYVSPTSMETVPNERSDFQLHMKPSHTRAVVALIQQYQWRSFHYVYDSEEGLYRIQEIIRMFEEAKYYRHNIRIRQLPDPTNAHEDLRALDRMETSDNSTEKLIVLDLSSQSAYRDVMRQIREVGMNKEGYKYILGTVDFLNLEMDRYRHGGVNITGFQLVNYTSDFMEEFLELYRMRDARTMGATSNTYVHIDTALAIDAIKVTQKTLTELTTRSNAIFKTTFRRGKVFNHNQTEGVPCDTDPPVPWMHGKALMRGMKNLKFEGVTGNVEFDEKGFRKNYKFDIYNVGLNRWPFKIGEWSSENGIGFEADNFKVKEVENKTEYIYTVTTIEYKKAEYRKPDVDTVPIRQRWFPTTSIGLIPISGMSEPAQTPSSTRKNGTTIVVTYVTDSVRDSKAVYGTRKEYGESSSALKCLMPENFLLLTAHVITFVLSSYCYCC